MPAVRKKGPPGHSPDGPSRYQLQQTRRCGRARSTALLAKPPANRASEAVQTGPDSVDIAMLSADSTAQDLIGSADRGLYRAKADGKNCVRLAP